MPTVNDAIVRTKRLVHSNTRTELNNFLTTTGETNSTGTGTSTGTVVDSTDCM